MDMAVVVVVSLLLVLTVGASSVAGQDYVAPRTAFGKPDLSGIWQAIGDHHLNIESHAASQGPSGLGAVFSGRAGLDIVQGGEIPYTAAARARQRENAQHWVGRDPAAKCYMPGIPRATYMPYPFQIVQTEEYILFAYEFAGATRVVYMNRPDLEGADPSWMGHSRGSWDGETLVIEVTDQVPDTWLDRNGNHHSDQIHVVERYTATSPDHLQYEATIEDPEVYTRPWTLGLPLYRRIDENMQLLEFKCVEFAEEFMYERSRSPADQTPASRPTRNTLVPEIGAEVTPIGELTAWERYPSGFSLSRGREVTSIHPGEEYVVAETRVIASILSGDSYYVRLRPKEDSEDVCALQSCWVYQGRERDFPLSNLVVR